MKNVKKLIALLLAIACMFAFAACGTEGGENTVPSDPVETLDEQLDDVFDQMESIATENAGQDVGNYAEGSDSDFVWEDTEGGVVITEYIGTGTSVAVPAQLGGKDVVEIGVGAFEDAAVVGVSLPDTVTVINDQAFFFCTALVEVRLGAGVKTIGMEAFSGCLALSSVQLNEGLQTIGDSAFAMCSSLQRIVIPGTVELIDAGAFVMSGLVSVTIPGSVQTVGEQAFSTCSELTEVIIESGVKVLDSKAFEDCQKLIRVEVPASVETLEFAVFRYSDNLTVYAPTGSAAEVYAQENDVNFQSN